MLSDSIREQARAAIAARFKLRDDVLVKELEQLASKAADETEVDEVNRLGIRLRLICEHDLFERAFIVWNNLKRAHEEFGAVKSQGLMVDFVTEARAHMKEATISLASHLSRHSDDLARAFKGRNGLDAKWLGKLRDRSIEKYSHDMEDYINSLSWGFKSLVGGMRGNSETDS
jgi:hypothetical protein